MKSENQTTSVQIDEFLGTLGLSYTERVKEASYWQDCRQEIRRAGGDPEAVLQQGGPMEIPVVDMYFMTERIACTFLAADVPRLYQVLESFETRNIIPESTRSVAEVGGGPGIVSLWLARKHPGMRFTVYDHARNPLLLGKAWARRLGLDNIDYVQASYRELAQKSSPNRFDLILGLSVLDLLIETRNTPLSIDPAPEIANPRTRKGLTQFTQACRTLLAPSGSLYFSQGAFNHQGLFCLFDALRQAGLGIDWFRTHSRGEGEGPGFSFKEIHIFAGPGQPTVFGSALEETRTFLYDGGSDPGQRHLLGHNDFETYLGLLATGTKLADIRIEKKNRERERHSIYVKSGMLGFFSSHSSGSRSGFVHSAAAFIPSCQRLMAVIGRYKAMDIRITHEFWHPFFR